jgi:ABC-2 type transport system ATP-binding protein
MEPVLSVKKLKKVYGGTFVAVDEISFDLGAGEILGLLGPNGSGKTTTIQMLLRTLTKTSGSIVYFGKDLYEHASEILQHVSYASTYSNLPHILTVEENLKVFGRLYGLKPQETVRRTGPLLERFGIADKWKERVSTLSAGQITRLMLVKAFFIEPKVVLLDEPTASLDPDIAKDVCQFLSDERERSGLSILFTSHKMNEVSELCDRVIFLKQGKIIANDLPKNLAKSILSHRLQLVILDGLKRTQALAEKRKLNYQVEHRTMTISMDDSMIPSFLNELAQTQVTYSSIRIEEPSLEDYFLQIAEDR